MSREIVFITGNRNKVNEIQKAIDPLDYTVIQNDLDYPEIQSTSLEDVVRYGIEWIKDSVDIFFLEDSGLFVERLNGFPGVYSKFVFESIGNQGILKLMEYVEDRNAVFKTVIGFYDGEAKIFKGQCKGRIAKRPKGGHGFGYDPIFIPDGTTNTFGEMETYQKNEYSHRAKALKSFIHYLKKR